jgi:hypothetical protein
MKDASLLLLLVRKCTERHTSQTRALEKVEHVNHPPVRDLTIGLDDGPQISIAS